MVVRNQLILRLTVAFALFVVAEYAVWIGMLVYAYQRGGATASGLVAMAQLLPGALLAPMVAGVADRRSPTVLLVAGYLVQSLGMIGAALALTVGAPPLVVYGFAVLASTAMCAVRPAQYTLLPAVSRDVHELTAANVVAGWAESGGIVLGAVAAALFLDVNHIDLLFVVTAAFEVVCAALVAPAKVPGIAVADDNEFASVLSHWLEGARAASADSRRRLLVGLLTVQFVVEGALDVLLVVIAIRVLDEGQGWVGYLNTAYGIGGVAAGMLTAQLLWRRIGMLIAVSVAALGAGLALTAFSHEPSLTVALLAVVGAARAVLSVSANTLLQRVVPARVVGRVFGLVEGFTNAGLALGAGLAPLLIDLGGCQLAVVITACLLPAFAAAGVGTLRQLDKSATTPIVEVALLRSLPHFAELPASALETLACAAGRTEAEPGRLIIRQGDEGDRFYAIVDGLVATSVNGWPRGSMSRGQGFGEIALLRRTPRTATVVAVEPTTLLELDSTSFLTALSGHAATRRRVDGVVDRLTEADARDS